MDTVLVKLFALAEKTRDLYTLIQETNDIAISEVEPVIKKTGQYNALCMLYKQAGHDLKQLEIWSKCVLELHRFRSNKPAELSMVNGPTKISKTHYPIWSPFSPRRRIVL